jgi:hypothetical protein
MSGLSVREFVKLSLVEIVRGVADAQAEVRGETARIGPKLAGGSARMVEFDIAVTAEHAANAQGTMRVTVAGLFSGSAEAGKGRTTSTVSRLKFQVPVVLPREGTDT